MLDLRRGTLLVLSLALACAAATAHAQQDDPRMAEARARFDPAIAIFDQGDYAGALAEFERIHQLLEGHPRRFFVLYNIARCQEALFRYDAAIDTYERYLREGGAGTEQAQDARERITTLGQRLATLIVESNVAAEVWIDDHLVGNAPGSVRVTAGSHRVELRARGYAPARQPLQIAARTQETLRFSLDRVSAGLSPAFFLSGAGLTLVAAGVGTGFGVAALSERGTISSRLASSDPSQRFQVTQAQIAAMEQTAILADVFFGAALLFGVASTVLLFVTDWGGGDASSASASVQLAPFASDHAAGLLLGGTF
jgi:tetratricopeptide (TPR) repeat protein